MATFPVPCGIFVGMTQAQLQAALADAQAAYIGLMTGKKGVTFAYASGDGQKSVTYQQTSIANLNAFIMQLQLALGLPCGRRRPLRPLYGP